MGKTGELEKAAGKMTGAEKLKRARQSDELRGTAQSTAGGLKHALREQTDQSSS